MHPLHQALLSAQDTIEKLTRENVSLREENARLKLMELSTSDDLEELTGAYTQAKKENEEMEARVKKMEEDFQMDKKTWQDLSRQQLREISSFRVQLSVAQSHSHRMEDEVRESKRELYEGRRQVEREIASLGESLYIQREESAARRSAMESWQNIVQEMERKNELGKMWLQKEEEWRRKTNALEEEIKRLTNKSAQLPVNCLY